MHDSIGRLLYAKQPEQDANTAFSGTNYTDPITSNNQWSVKYTYDSNGNIATTTDARNQTITATYDNLNRITKRDYSDSTMPDVDFFYDGKGLGAVPAHSNGKTTKVTSSVSETRYTSFDNLGRLLTHQQITDGQTYGTSYTYNLSGGIVSETYPSGRTVNYELNSDGELAHVWGQKGLTATSYANAFSYNASGGVTSLRLGNGKWETAQYNNRLQITQIGLGNSSADVSLLKINYDYGNSTQNNGSLREQKINYTGLSSEIKQTYTYDDLNRLKSSTETYNNGATQSWKETFNYDRFGNRTFDAANTTTLGSCSTAVCNPTISTANNRFSTGQGYSYDASGDLTQDATGQRFNYDAENHQKEFFAASNSGSTPDATYYYDGDGKRVKKVSQTETTIFVYDASGQLVAEYSTQIATTPKITYLTQDHLGSPRIVTDQNGVVVSRHDYTGFGKDVAENLGSVGGRTSQQGYGVDDKVRQQYTGYERDDESGLEFAQARYYNAQHGRFTSVDPLTGSANVKDPQTLNRYSYTLNSPYKFTDPLGLVTMGAGSGASGGMDVAQGFRLLEHGYNVDSAVGGDPWFEAAFAEMALGREVAAALASLASNAFANSFGSGATDDERKAITDGLQDILQNGNKAAKAIAKAIVNTGISIDVASKAVIGASGDTQFSGDSMYTNLAIKNGQLSVADAMGKLMIRIAREEFSNAVSAIAAVEGNLIHEGSHAIAMAEVLHSMAVSSKDLVLDKSLMNDELDAKMADAQYKIDRGGDFVKHGKAAGLIDASGKMNMTAIKAAAETFRGQTIMGYLKSQGVHKN